MIYTTIVKFLLKGRAMFTLGLQRSAVVLVLAVVSLMALSSVFDSRVKAEAQTLAPASPPTEGSASVASIITLSAQLQPASAVVERFQGLVAGPDQVAVNPTAGYVYVGGYGGNQSTVLTGTQVVTNLTVGEGPLDIAVNPATGYVYVAVIGDNKVAILSGTHVITAVAAGLIPRAVAVNPFNGYVYVANQDSANVTVLSGTEVITTLLTGNVPYDVAVDPQSEYAYVSNNSDNTITVIHGLEVVGTVPGGGDPREIEVDPVRGYAYVINAQGSVSVLSGMQMIGSATIPSPYRIAVNPGGYAYVTSFPDNVVTVLSGAQVIATVPTAGNRYTAAVGVNTQSGRVYAFSVNDDFTLTFIDVISGTRRVKTLATAPGILPFEMSINPNTGYVYAPAFSDMLIVSSDDQILSLFPGAALTSIATNESTGRTYVSVGNNTVAVFSATQLITTLPAGSSPAAIGANSTTGLTYVANQWSNNVTIISGTQVLTTTTVGFSPIAIGVNETTGFAYVVNRDGPTPITVLSGTHTLTTIAWPNPEGEKQIAVDAAANRAYVLNAARDELIVLAGTQVVTRVVMGPEPSALAVNPIGGYVYVTDKISNTVTVLDGTHVITTLSTIAPPVALAVNPTTGQAYIVGRGITVLSGTHSSATIAAGCDLIDVEIDSGTGLVYALDKATQTMFVVSDTQVLNRLPVERQPSIVHVNSTNHAVYVGSANTDSLSIFYGDELTLRSSFARLTGPADTLVIDFGQPVLTATIQFDITPTVNHTATWAAAADRLMIALDAVESTTFYRLQFMPGAHTESGVKLVLPDSVHLIWQPFESFLSLVGRNTGCTY